MSSVERITEDFDAASRIDSQTEIVAREVGFAELAAGFLLVGLLGFGGIAASAQYVTVERNKWLSQQEFVELFGVGSILPGGNFLNATVMLGDRFQGPLGSIVGLSSLLFAPLLILMGIAAAFDAYAHLPDVQAAVTGSAAAAAGLIIATAARMTGGLKGGVLTWVIGVVTFVAIALFRLPLPWVVGLLAPASVALAILADRRRSRQAFASRSGELP